MLVYRDVQQGKITKSGAAETRIDATATHGHGQAVGDLKSPECRHDRAMIGHQLEEATDRPVVSSP